MVEVTDSTGVLEITFDRNFFDSTYEGLDDDFFVFDSVTQESLREESTINRKIRRYLKQGRTQEDAGKRAREELKAIDLDALDNAQEAKRQKK